jgi:hypothetical protein
MTKMLSLRMYQSWTKWDIKLIKSMENGYMSLFKVLKNKLLWINQVYYWRSKSKMHKHYILFTMIITMEIMHKSK